MQTQPLRRIAAACLFLNAAAMTLAGCGSHDQNTPATPAQIQMGKQQEQQAAFSRTAAGGQKPVINPHAATSAPSAEAGEQKQ